MNTAIEGFKRTTIGDHVGLRSYLGMCCGCRAQFMSTHEVVYVPSDATRKANPRFVHGPACESCARKSKTEHKP